MTTSTDVQFVQPYASIHPQVNHMPKHRCVTVRVHDDAKNYVVLYFKATDGVSELAVAEAWLRDALAKVEVAKIDAANDQPAPVLPERVSNEGEVCGTELAYGIPGVDEVVWTCVRPAGHDGECTNWPGIDQSAPVTDHNAAREDWRRYLDEGGTADFQTWWERYKGDYPRIGEPLDLTAVAP